MKKKILALALVVALVAIMVGGSLAYFTADDEVKNVFTVGAVKIEIFENDAATPDDEMTFGSLIPVVDPTNPDDPGYQKKAVEVQNTGINNAYIRLHIAIPTKLVGYLYLHLDEAGWTRQADSTAVVGAVDGVGGDSYTVFTYDYNTAVEKGNFTSELLKGVYLGADVDLVENENNADEMLFVRRENSKIVDESGFVAVTWDGFKHKHVSTPINVLVAAQAIQADGFADATSALNAGFGEGTNPWQAN